MGYHWAMDRGLTFVPGEVYHIYNRGVEKRTIFQGSRDWQHFQELLYISNNTEPLASKLMPKNSYEFKRKGTIIDLLGYAQMTNHYHLIVLEKIDGGISKFMSKFGTAYSMFFNTKYERSGPLFCKPFRAKHVYSDDYLRWLFGYVHLNPLIIYDPAWEKNVRTKQINEAQKFLREYRFSSYWDYFSGEREESRILNKNVLPVDISDLENAGEMLKEYRSWAPPGYPVLV